MISQPLSYQKPDPWVINTNPNYGLANTIPSTYAVGTPTTYGTTPTSNYPPSSWYASNQQAYTDASKVFAPVVTDTKIDASNKVVAPTDIKLAKIDYAPTEIYAPATTINNEAFYNYIQNITQAAAPAPVYPPPPTPPVFPKIEIPKIEFPPIQQYQTQTIETKKEGGLGSILPWIIGGGLLLLGPKLFGGNKAEAKAEATAVAKTAVEVETPEVRRRERPDRPEKVEKTPETPETPAKKGEVRVNFTGYGDPKFMDARTKKVIDITKAGDHTLVKDANSDLSVHMTKDTAGNVYMDALNYSVSGSDIKADASGKVSVDGKEVKIGDTVNLKNGGSVKVEAGTKGSSREKNGKATIIIKTGTGENLTAFIQTRKSADKKPYYEFNFSKANDEGDTDETVTGGDLLPFFKNAPVTEKKSTTKKEEELKKDP